MFTWRTFTEVSSHTVVTGPAVEAHLLLTVVLVRLAVLADVAVDADALVAALRVLTRAVVLTRVVVGALVHVPRAVAVSPGGRALARVGADAVHAAAAVLAVADAIGTRRFHGVGQFKATLGVAARHDTRSGIRVLARRVGRVDRRGAAVGRAASPRRTTAILRAHAARGRAAGGRQALSWRLAK